MMLRRTPVLASAIGLVLVSCGGGTETDTASPVTDESSATVATGAEVETEGTETTTEPTVVTDAPSDSLASPDPTAAPAPDATNAPAEVDAPVEPAAESTEPVPAEVGGRALATEIGADSQFDGNPFPDLVVDDVGRAGAANLANLLPSDRPILLWAWAPH